MFNLSCDERNSFPNDDDHIAFLQDEAEWDRLFEKYQDSLAKAARKASLEVKENRFEPFDLDRL